MKFVLGGKYLFLTKFRRLQHGVVGVRSDCGNDKHVFFLDLDNVNPRWLEESIIRIQRQYRMNDIYVIRSSSTSYHIVELTPRSFGEVIDIQRAFDVYMTKRYQMFAVVRDYWVLRCTEKIGSPSPELVAIYPGNHTKSVCPTHAKYIANHFGVIFDSVKKTSYHRLAFDTYPTVKKKETKGDDMFE